MKCTWSSPSNIALVKYWGKYGRQLPRNASISFTLSACHTKTSLTVVPDQGSFALDFRFEGKPNVHFAQRIEKFLSSIHDHLPWLAHAHVTIDSENTFPHSSGIASSASAMSALAMCLTDVNGKISGSDTLDYRLASEIARLGSGSASRSVISKLGVWGACSLDGSSNHYAIDYSDSVDSVFHTYHDDICIVSDLEKSVSSSAGHGLMDKSPYASTRYQQANDRLAKLAAAMKSADLETFIDIVENEALTLHGLMLSSEPGYVLMSPNTINLIHEIRSYREENKIPVCFTLDAGPNIHLLYPDQYAGEVSEWKENTLKQFCVENRIINDNVGNGPVKIL